MEGCFIFEAVDLRKRIRSHNLKNIHSISGAANSLGRMKSCELRLNKDTELQLFVFVSFTSVIHTFLCLSSLRCIHLETVMNRCNKSLKLLISEFESHEKISSLVFFAFPKLEIYSK